MKFLKFSIFNVQDGRFSLDKISIIEMEKESSEVFEFELNKFISTLEETVGEVIYILDDGLSPLRVKSLDVSVKGKYFFIDRFIAGVEKEQPEYTFTYGHQQFSINSEKPKQSEVFIYNSARKETLIKVLEIFHRVGLDQVSIVDPLMILRELIPKYGNYVLIDIGEHNTKLLKVSNKRIIDSRLINQDFCSEALFSILSDDDSGTADIVNMSIDQIIAGEILSRDLDTILKDNAFAKDLLYKNTKVMFVGGLATKPIEELISRDAERVYYENDMDFINEFDIHNHMKSLMAPSIAAVKYIISGDSMVYNGINRTAIAKINKKAKYVMIAGITLLLFAVSLNFIAKSTYISEVEKMPAIADLSSVQEKIDLEVEAIENLINEENSNISVDLDFSTLHNYLNLYSTSAINFLNIKFQDNILVISLQSTNMSDVRVLKYKLEEVLFKRIEVTIDDVEGGVYLVKMRCWR